jgi:diacylglycerol O-acyltransferase
MSYELLRPEDATLLYAQDPRAPLQIGAVALFDATALRHDDRSLRLDDLRCHIESRLPHPHRFRQRLVDTAFGFGAPVWVDDPAFAIDNHVRSTALPRPGDTRRLREVVDRLLEQPLDPERPLWEVWMVEGVAGNRVALVVKASHVMADGMALLEFVVTVLDASPHAAAPHPPAPRQGDERRVVPPAGVALVAGAAVGRTRRQLASAVRAAGGLSRPRAVMSTAATLARAAVGARPAPASAITRPVGRHRRMAWFRQPLAEVQAVRRAQGVTLNDLVLAAVAGALRRYPDPAGPGQGVHPRALVPASTHGPAPAAEVENRFSILLADLPLSVEGPLDRLQWVHAEMERRKRSAESSVGSLLLAVSDVVPGWLIRRLAPSILGRQPVVNLAVTNLPGTTQPLYLLGARMREVYPFVTVIGNIAMIVGVISYADSLGIGITVDPDVIPDPDRFAGALAAAFDELVQADGGAAPRPSEGTG